MSDNKPESIHDFDATAKKNQDVKHSLIRVEECTNSLIAVAEALTDSQVARLLAALHSAGKMKQGEGDESGEDFNPAYEVAMLLKTVKALRNQVMVNGDIKHGVSIGEAHKVVTACGGMINTLMKYEEQLHNMERYRAVEGAVIDTLKDLEETNPEAGPVVDRFMLNLERRLEAVN